MLNAGENSATPPLLRLHRIDKSLAGRRVLHEVDLSVAPGELVALLGPNGAGKTTLLRIASGRLAADSGTVELAGGNPRTQPAIRKSLGLVPQEIALYSNLTVRENLQIFGRMMGVTRKDLEAQVSTALDWSGLNERADDRTDQLSGGMQRRLNIVASLLHQPDLLMLDEPTAGVDVNARERIHELLRSLRAHGLGILLTTHDLQQASMLADRVVFLIDGAVRLNGHPSSLIQEVYGADKAIDITFSRAPSAEQQLALSELGLRTSQAGLTWRGRAPDGIEAVASWSLKLSDLGLNAEEIRIREPDLDAVFAHLTGEELKL